MTEEKSKFRFHLLSALIGFFIGMVCVLIWQVVFSSLFSHLFHFHLTEKNANSSKNKSPFSLFMQKGISPQDLNDESQNENQQESQDEDFEQNLNQFFKQQLGQLKSMGLGDGIGELTQHEDKNFYYIEISIKGLDRQSLNVEVKDGQITLKGQIHEQNNLGVDLTESFHRSFPVPNNVDPQKVDIQNNDETLTLKFPKISE